MIKIVGCLIGEWMIYIFFSSIDNMCGIATNASYPIV